ncbi:MAG: DEAD/DEAH box helicase [Spirochaetota bacterium]|jgi:ATP-dependent RNA helicase DeaD|nr:DEAD/DEAH box helicase [Spirochaetota bacterium]
MTVEFDKFSELELSDKVQAALVKYSFVVPTPIQRLVLPDALQGRDVFGQAQTGTGKTLAFAIPIAERLDPHKKFVQAIVLVPTRELAKQVAAEVEKVTVLIPEYRVVAIYGGVGQQPQVDALAAGAQIVVGTPGRVADLMRQKQLKLNQVHIAVLDEVDEMLDMGFYEEVHTIMSAVPRSRQTMFFSATLPPRIQKMAQNYLHKEVVHSTSLENVLVDTTEHFFCEIHGADDEDAAAPASAERSRGRTGTRVSVREGRSQANERLRCLMRIIDCERITKAIIFTNTKIDTDEVYRSLIKEGYPVENLHGDLPQSKREAVMARFRSGETTIIVATDVAARGLDIREVTHVIHYHVPLDPELFVHRTGRTGRAGASGRSILLISPAEYHDLFKIQEANHIAIHKLPVPDEEQAYSERMKKMFDKILQGIQTDDIRAVYKEMKKHIPFTKRGKALAWLVLQCSEGGFQLQASDKPDEGGFQRKIHGKQNAGQTAHPRAGGYSDAVSHTARKHPVSDAGGATARLFMNIGRKHGANESSIRSFIAAESGVDESRITHVHIRDGYSHVSVAQEKAEAIISAVNEKKFDRYAVKIESARPEGRPAREGTGSRRERTGHTRDKKSGDFHRSRQTGVHVRHRGHNAQGNNDNQGE